MKGKKEFHPDEETLRKVQGLYIEIRRILGSLFPGHHRSRVRGRGADFVELREYSWGDDIRDLDWKVFGKREKFMVRVREDKGRINVYIYLDNSRSMNYGSPSKSDFAIKMAGVLGTLALTQSDRLFFKTFSGGPEIPPLSTSQRIPLFLSALLSVDFSAHLKPSDFILKSIGETERPAKVILISDMMEEKSEILFEENVEFDLIHVVSPQEEEGVDEEGIFVEPEEEEKLSLDFSSIKKEYRIEFERWREELSKKFLSTGGIYVYAPTSRKIDEILLKYLHLAKEVR